MYIITSLNITRGSWTHKCKGKRVLWKSRFCQK